MDGGRRKCGYIMRKFIKANREKAFHLFIYLGGSIIPMVISIAVNPLVALNMSPDDYAIVGYYTAFNPLFMPLINFYLIHYYTKKFFELEPDDRIHLKASLFQILIYFSIAMSIVIVGILFLYHFYINEGSEIKFFPYGVLSIMSMPLLGVFSLMLAEYRMERRSVAFFGLSLAHGILSIILTIFLVIIYKKGAFGKLLAIFIGNLIVFVYCILKNKEFLSRKYDKKILRNALIFSLPLVLAAMLSFFSSGFDKIILERFGTVQELGFYVVGVQIAGFLTVFSTSIDNTFQPDIFKSVVDKDYRKCFKVIVIKIGLLTTIITVFIFSAPWLVSVLTAKRYEASTPFAIILSLSAITSMIYHSFSQVTIALGLTKITLLNKIGGSIVCIILFIYFIKHWGALGAAWAVVGSFIIYFLGNVMLVVLSKRLRILI